MLILVLLIFQPSNRILNHLLKLSSTGYIINFIVEASVAFRYYAKYWLHFLLMNKGLRGFERGLSISLNNNYSIILFHKKHFRRCIIYYFIIFRFSFF